jgi:hypothetical protein
MGAGRPHRDAERRWMPGVGWAVLTAGALLLAGCASMNVSSYSPRGVDLQRYSTYTWAAPDRLSTGDPRLDNNPFFQQRLQASVDRALAARGFGQQAAMPDLIVHYHASVTQRIDLNGVDREFAQCDSPECQPVAYESGTIVLDLVDTATARLVWRGWATGSLEGAIDNQDFLEQRIDEAVGRIMERLPRSPSR